MIMHEYRSSKLGGDTGGQGRRLARLGPSVTPFLLLNLIRPDNNKVDPIVVHALVELREEKLPKALMDLMRSEDKGVRGSAVDSIWGEIAYRNREAARMFETKPIISMVESIANADPDPDNRIRGQRLLMWMTEDKHTASINSESASGSPASGISK
jgi:hypothetical protein